MKARKASRERMSVIPVKLRMYPTLLNDVAKLREESRVSVTKSRHSHDY